MYCLIRCDQKGISVVGASHRMNLGVGLSCHNVMSTKPYPVTNSRFFSYRIEKVVSPKFLHPKIGLDIDLVCPTSSFFTNIVTKSNWMRAIAWPCGIQRSRASLLCAKALCMSTILAYILNLNTWLNTQAQIWVALEFGVRSIALCGLLWWIWSSPVYSLWNSACSARTLACMRVGFIATYCGNTTRGVFLFEDDKDSIVLVTEPQIPVKLKSVLAGLTIYFGCYWVV